MPLLAVGGRMRRRGGLGGRARARGSSSGGARRRRVELRRPRVAAGRSCGGGGATEAVGGGAWAGRRCRGGGRCSGRRRGWSFGGRYEAAEEKELGRPSATRATEEEGAGVKGGEEGEASVWVAVSGAPFVGRAAGLSAKWVGE
ncbi:hypothetical protein PR202_gb20824 [Eleusine coracana subsp. coracana]|uniref:Uncharacterized protein n=1 Tax=Eleusine coracana subsp. coracana TaxID=191504 RepID=A0AAV5F9I4_ELECO|nr:hypothetical protein PR202_gb20824 [Eleusine coracana subsp. coracana]